jgi:transposase InsO family protein
MAKDGVAVRAEIASAVATFVGSDGDRMNVAATCRQLEISRKTFYKYVARYRMAGVEGLFPDSRRPRSSPTRLSTALEDVLVRLRKQEHDAGWDYGADAVLMRLEERRDELWPVERVLPSRATVNRVFDARGLLAKTPKRRPRRRYRRFERSHVNALWQFDGFDYRLADDTVAVVLHLTDDCSRVDLALQAAASENGDDIWATFCTAAEQYGLPAQLLTDNGNAFSGKRRGWISAFERRLAQLSVEAITSRVAHPETCGKNERAHQRVQKWLARQPRATTLAELQALLDTYRAAYNTRRNRVLANLTPAERYTLGPTAYPTPFQTPTEVTHHQVSSRGSIGIDHVQIGLGRRHSRKPTTVFRTGDHLVIFADNEMIRELILDHTRTYQGQDR